MSLAAGCETHYVTGGRNCPERKEIDKTVPAFLPLSYSLEIRCDGRAWAATLWHEGRDGCVLRVEEQDDGGSESLPPGTPRTPQVLFTPELGEKKMPFSPAYATVTLCY